MTPDPDLYARLGVSRDATEEQIRDAYRAGVQHGGAWAHPDTCPGDPEAVERFRTATEAFEVLSDPERRAEYDGRSVNDAAVIGAFIHDLGAELLHEVEAEAHGENFGTRGKRAAARATRHLGSMLRQPEGQQKIRTFVRAGWRLFLDLSRT